MEPIIDESLLNFFFFIKYCLEEEISFARDIRLLIIALFYRKGAFTFRVEGREVIISYTWKKKTTFFSNI